MTLIFNPVASSTFASQSSKSGSVVLILYKVRSYFSAADTLTTFPIIPATIVAAKTALNTFFLIFSPFPNNSLASAVLCYLVIKE